MIVSAVTDFQQRDPYYSHRRLKLRVLTIRVITELVVEGWRYAGVRFVHC